MSSDSNGFSVLRMHFLRFKHHILVSILFSCWSLIPLQQKTEVENGYPKVPSWESSLYIHTCYWRLCSELQYLAGTMGKEWASKIIYMRNGTLTHSFFLKRMRTTYNFNMYHQPNSVKCECSNCFLGSIQNLKH